MVYFLKGPPRLINDGMVQAWRSSMKKAAGATPNQRLINERLHWQWLQKDVTEQIGTTPITVCRWERGITVPGSHFRHLLCTLYAKSAEELDFLPEDLLASSEYVDSALVSVQDQVIEQQIIS